MAVATAIREALPTVEVGTPAFAELPFVPLTGDLPTIETALSPIDGVIAVRSVSGSTAKTVYGFEVALAHQRAVEGAVEPNGFGRLVEGWQPGTIPAYPVLAAGRDPPLDWNADLILPTRHGRLAAINMSIGTDEVPPYDEHDPVNVATRVATRRVPVVAAVGNAGYISDGVETMSVWAQPPWVISVAATTLADGGSLARYSSVGDKRNRRIHPTVAAYGGSELNEKKKGTSFAAPRVTRQMIAFTCFCETLSSALSGLLGQEKGIPLPWVFFVDCEIEGMYRPEKPLPALPRAAIDIHTLQEALPVLLSAGGIIRDLHPTPARVKRMLLASARRLGKLSRREVGEGFISDETTTSYLERFSIADLADVFVPAFARRQGESLRRLGKAILTVPTEINVLQQVWYGFQIHSGWDIGVCDGALGVERMEIVVRG
jgi:hypothetical protein